LPIYYVTRDELSPDLDSSNSIANIIKSRNWADWGTLRFEPLASPALRAEIASLGTTIKATIKELEGVFAAPKEITSEKSHQAPFVSLPLSRAEFLLEVPIARQEHFSKDHLDKIHKHAYYAYTDKFDEVITPADIVEPAVIMNLHSYLLKQVPEENESYNSQSSASIAGIVDASKGKSVAISFVIDNSASMRGNGALCTVTPGLISFCFSAWGACPPAAGLPSRLDRWTASRPSRFAPCLRARRYRFERMALVGSLERPLGGRLRFRRRAGEARNVVGRGIGINLNHGDPVQDVRLILGRPRIEAPPTTTSEADASFIA
jgi:hypothetical protein